MDACDPIHSKGKQEDQYTGENRENKAGLFGIMLGSDRAGCIQISRCKTDQCEENHQYQFRSVQIDQIACLEHTDQRPGVVADRIKAKDTACDKQCEKFHKTAHGLTCKSTAKRPVLHMRVKIKQNI